VPPPPGPEVFAGAGDIALCAGGQQDLTAGLLDTIGGTLFTLGDNVYSSGTRDEFRNCYDRSWGRHKGRTRPSPGNHDYVTPGGAAYYEYFGANAGPAGLGYYAFDLGAWHILSLNSNAEAGVGVGPGSPQYQWLQSDLAANAAKCTLAYWHHPLFTSGQNGENRFMRPMFELLYNANADVVLAGHDHLYERFAPQAPDGRTDAARGIREFVVGTGGVPLYQFLSTRPNSEVRINNQHGVLKLTLMTDSYQWELLTRDGIRDQGTTACH
jgi:3',5'-cyclic AMP phosphodiesterase CpdA